ncbi:MULTISPECIES: hypothetical protein [Streptomyces]|uniref:hypothetical protein n=1 Tax=Streptomyces TaxID=1883 RepID=UPI0036B7A33B
MATSIRLGEDGVGDRVVAVFEEREVDQAGAVFEGDEDDVLAGRDRRGLCGGAHAGHEDLEPLARGGSAFRNRGQETG